MSSGIIWEHVEHDDKLCLGEHWRARHANRTVGAVVREPEGDLKSIAIAIDRRPHVATLVGYDLALAMIETERTLHALGWRA